MILNILWSGDVGGIEKMLFDIGKIDNNFMFLFIKPYGVIYEEMKKNKMNVDSVLSKNRKTKITDIKFIFNKIEIIFLKNNIESIIFHDNSPFFLMILLKLRKKYNNINLFLYAHSNAYDFLNLKSRKSFINVFFYKKATKKVNGIFAISESVKKSILKIIPWANNKIILNYNGTDLTKFTPNYKNANLTLKIIYVGRLMKEKGVQNIIEILNHINDINFEFNIVGDGPYRKTLEEMVLKNSLKDKIKFLGSRNDVPNLLYESDIFIHLPSYEEGFGITIIEALASGLICVVNEKGAMKELITDGENGFILVSNDEYNYKKLHDIMLKTYNNQLNNIKNNAIESSKKFDILNTINIINIFAKKTFNIK